jgi:hypothetical protein
MKIQGRVTEGHFTNMREVYRGLRSFEGENITVRIDKRKPPRTLPQNAYLWGVVYSTIGDFTGYSPEELHYELEDLLHLRTYTDDHGNRRVKPSSQMSIDELSEYIGKVKLWAWHTLNLYIPDPNDPV